MNFLPAYLRERFPVRVFVPVILGLALAACAAGGTVRPASFPQAILLCALLVFQFRLWDDLADIEVDRKNHPGRVLVRSGIAQALPFLLTAAVAAAVLAWQLGGIAPLVTVLALNLVFGALYGGLRRIVPQRGWIWALLPLKYPAFALIAGHAVGTLSPGRAAVAAAAVFAGAIAYEWRDTARKTQTVTRENPGAASS